MFSHGNLHARHFGYFTGTTNTYSKMTWNDVDVSKDTYFRSITPRARSYGVGAYNADTMLNMSAFRNSAGKVGSAGYFWANGESITASTSQVTALADRPAVFWDSRRWDYATAGSPGTFVSQNNDHYYSIWRLSDGSDIIFDVTGGGRGAAILSNYSSWDNQLFTINGEGQGATANGTPLTKIRIPAANTDFSSAHPLLMSLVGGLPRNGGDIMSKNEPGDAYHLAADYDYYFNYYPKYDGTSKKLLAKDEGLDWYSIINRPQIDGSQSVTAIAATAAGAATGYSRVGRKYHIYEAYYIGNNS